MVLTLVITRVKVANLWIPTIDTTPDRVKVEVLMIHPHQVPKHNKQSKKLRKASLAYLGTNINGT